MSVSPPDDWRVYHDRDPSATPLEMHYPSIPARAEQLSVFRRIITRWAKGVGMVAESVHALTLATYEAMTNVVLHAYRGGSGVLGLHAVYHPEAQEVTVTVSDRGHWQPPVPRDGDCPAPGGRGIALIRALAEVADISSGAGGTTVRMSWHTA